MNKIINNFNWLLISSVIFGFSQWLIISLLNKFVNIEVVGYYVIALSLVSPIFILLNMNIEIVQITDQNNEFKFRMFYNFRFLTSIVALIIVGLISIFTDPLIYDKKIIVLITIWKVIESQINIFYGIYQRDENMSVLAYSRMLRALSNVFAIAFGIILLKDLYQALLIVIVFNSLILYREQSVNGFKVFKYEENTLSLKLFKILLLLSLPLAFSNFLDSMGINIQRILMGKFLTVTEVGYYASLTFIMIAGNTVFSALGRAFLPTLSRLFSVDLFKFIKLTVKMYFLGLFLSTIMIFISIYFSDMILTVLYNREYLNYKTEFILIMIAAGLWYSGGFINMSVYATQKFNNQVYVYLLTFLTLAVSTYISLSMDKGLKGVAVSLIIGMLTKKIMLLIVLTHLSIKEKYRNEKLK